MFKQNLQSIVRLFQMKIVLPSAIYEQYKQFQSLIDIYFLGIKLD